ncbi:hypothetical protein SLEP1_g11038 [Rubroshorea leprosula]|uniref:Glycosyltransferase n=1 Tax=Rubroshorea leprosula TaxID=152421 RepID=A0AAV5ILD7_9ROSI|nr:hypothetical protein SLEP1_g11038 [Rubroshorea leprosula]
MESFSVSIKPHAVCIPFPAQGHLNPMMKLAKLLHFKGFHITFVNTEFNHGRLLKYSRGAAALDSFPDFQFETIPDGLPPPQIEGQQDVPALCESTSKNCLVPFRNLLDRLNSTEGCPPISCIVSDGIMSFTLDAAKELGIPEVLFMTWSACGSLGYMLYKPLIDRGLTPLKDESYLTNGYLDTVIDWTPGKNIRLRDLPSFIQTTNQDDFLLKFVVSVLIERVQRASAVIFNTFHEFEHDVISVLTSMLPPIYTIGPLQLQLNQILQTHLRSINSNLWKEEPECLQWLDSKEPKSVVYVNFGSVTVLTAEQLVEFAWGLANSKQSFLWITRPDLVRGDSSILPPEFLEETKERSLMVNWCSQEEVLNHPAIGGFLTHSGWNSTIESVGCGVPMVCWPFFADQLTNCRYACTEWGIGMEIDGNVRRDEVEKLVRELMEGNKGKEMRKNAQEWKGKAEKAVSPEGSSFLNLEKLIKEVLLT